MKITHKCRRYINSSKYVDENSDDILFDDKIRVQIDIYFDDLKNYIASSSGSQFVKFPGKEQFRNDVISLLENKYHFDVIEDVYDGKLQKGHFSNREDSISLYIDTYLDLSNLKYMTSDPKANNIKGKMYCFIHIRFSDHDIPDSGDVLHRRFIEDNAQKYDNAEVTHQMKDEEFIVDEYDMNYYYNEALDDLDANIESRIEYWVKKADRYIKRSR